MKESYLPVQYRRKDLENTSAKGRLFQGDGCQNLTQLAIILHSRDNILRMISRHLNDCDRRPSESIEKAESLARFSDREGYGAVG